MDEQRGPWGNLHQPACRLRLCQVHAGHDARHQQRRVEKQLREAAGFFHCSLPGKNLRGIWEDLRKASCYAVACTAKAIRCERPWSLPRFATAARHLGQFSGAYLVSASLPDWPWLSRDWLRTVIAPTESVIHRLDDPTVLAHPLAGRWFPADVAAGLSQTWAERERFLAALDRLPQTLCHRDAFPRNLFLRGAGTDHEQTVAIDWAFTGPGAIGEDLVSLVQGSLFFCEFDLANAVALDQVVFDSYLTGLRDSGWQGDQRVVRLGYTAASALRWLMTIPLSLDLTLNADEHQIGWLEQTWGRPIEILSDLFADGRRFVSRLTNEARVLMGEVG